MSDFRVSDEIFYSTIYKPIFVCVGTGFFGKRFFVVKATHDYILVVVVVYRSRMLLATQVISLYH
jgi:hypothetical protein